MTDPTPEAQVPSELVLKFDPLTIEHLGSNMYSRLPNAVAELVANAYDADATEITVRVVGSGEAQHIVVEVWFPPNRGGLPYAASRAGAAVFS